jgi:hypothetical protein
MTDGPCTRPRGCRADGRHPPPNPYCSRQRGIVFERGCNKRDLGGFRLAYAPSEQQNLWRVHLHKVGTGLPLDAGRVRRGR